MNFFSDLKSGIRQFGKNPGSMALAVMAYALGLGLVGFMLTMIFGVVRGHPEGVDFESTQVMNWDDSTEHLWTNGAQTAGMRFVDFKDFQESQEVFDTLAAQNGATFNIVIGKYAERFSGGVVTAEFFDVLAARPQIGNFFAKGDDLPDSAKKIVISYDLWTNHFDSKESILGRSLIVNGLPATVIGVAREGFDFPSQNDVWMNQTINHIGMGRAEGDLLFILGQLKENISAGAATESLNTIAKRLEQQYPDSNTGYIAIELNLLSDVFLGQETSSMMYLMFACSVMVLLIACTNVANLTLSRATTRARELAIRSALGGRRRRLVIQMIVEGLSIAFVGGVGGLIIAIWTSKIFWGWITKGDSNSVPVWMNMDVDISVIAALSITTLIASVIASMVPALRASKADINEILKDSSRGATGMKMGIFTKGLALLQLCVSCGMLIATFTMVTNANENSVYEPYYDPSDMMVARFDLPETYRPGDQRPEALIHLQELLENNQALEGVGFTSANDMINNWPSRWEVRGMKDISDDGYTQGRHEIVSDNYFDLLGIPILYGRGFDNIDRGENAEQVGVINEILARRLWPDNLQDAIGQQFRDPWTDSNPWITIIGIVPDTKMAGPGATNADQTGGIYRPMSSAPQASLTIFAKTKGNPLIQANQIRSVLHAENESIALYRVKTVDVAVEEANFGPLFLRNIFGMFGIAALILASIGVYGVMDFSIRQRFQEFAIRQALGAGKATILKHVFKIGGFQITSGILLGVGLGWAIVKVLGTILGADDGFNPGVFEYLVPVAVIAAISAAALYTPARYVTNANLADSMRDE